MSKIFETTVATTPSSSSDATLVSLFISATEEKMDIVRYLFKQRNFTKAGNVLSTIIDDIKSITMCASDTSVAAVEIKIIHGLALSNRCATNFCKKNLPSALCDAKMCVEVRPRWIRGYERLGGVYEAMNDWAAASDAYSSALDVLDPTETASYDEIKSFLRNCELKQFSMKLRHNETSTVPDLENNSNNNNASAAAAASSSPSKTLTLSAEEAEPFLKEAADLFYTGNYSEAIDLYTRLIDTTYLTESGASSKEILSRETVVCRSLSNRSGCFCKLKNFQLALDDARLCLALRPSWVRAHLRIAAAAEESGQFDVAIAAYESAMSAEDRSGKVPSNKELEVDIVRVKLARTASQTDCKSSCHCCQPALLGGNEDAAAAQAVARPENKFYGCWYHVFLQRVSQKPLPLSPQDTPQAVEKKVENFLLERLLEKGIEKEKKSYNTVLCYGNSVDRVCKKCSKAFAGKSSSHTTSTYPHFEVAGVQIDSSLAASFHEVYDCEPGLDTTNTCTCGRKMSEFSATEKTGHASDRGKTKFSDHTNNRCRLWKCTCQRLFKSYDEFLKHLPNFPVSTCTEDPPSFTKPRSTYLVSRLSVGETSFPESSYRLVTFTESGLRLNLEGLYAVDVPWKDVSRRITGEKKHIVQFQMRKCPDSFKEVKVSPLAELPDNAKVYGIARASTVSNMLVDSLKIPEKLRSQNFHSSPLPPGGCITLELANEVSNTNATEETLQAIEATYNDQTEMYSSDCQIRNFFHCSVLNGWMNEAGVKSNHIGQKPDEIPDKAFTNACEKHSLVYGSTHQHLRIFWAFSPLLFKYGGWQKSLSRHSTVEIGSPRHLGTECCINKSSSIISHCSTHCKCDDGDLVPSLKHAAFAFFNSEERCHLLFNGHPSLRFVVSHLCHCGESSLEDGVCINRYHLCYEPNALNIARNKCAGKLVCSNCTITIEGCNCHPVAKCLHSRMAAGCSMCCRDDPFLNPTAFLKERERVANELVDAQRNEMKLDTGSRPPEVTRIMNDFEALSTDRFEKNEKHPLFHFSEQQLNKRWVKLNTKIERLNKKINGKDSKKFKSITERSSANIAYMTETGIEALKDVMFGAKQCKVTSTGCIERDDTCSERLRINTDSRSYVDLPGWFSCYTNVVACYAHEVKDTMSADQCDALALKIHFSMTASHLCSNEKCFNTACLHSESTLDNNGRKFCASIIACTDCDFALMQCDCQERFGADVKCFRVTKGTCAVCAAKKKETGPRCCNSSCNCNQQEANNREMKVLPNSTVPTSVVSSAKTRDRTRRDREREQQFLESASATGTFASCLEEDADFSRTSESSNAAKASATKNASKSNVKSKSKTASGTLLPGKSPHLSGH